MPDEKLETSVTLEEGKRRADMSARSPGSMGTTGSMIRNIVPIREIVTFRFSRSFGKTVPAMHTRSSREPGLLEQYV